MLTSRHLSQIGYSHGMLHFKVTVEEQSYLLTRRIEDSMLKKTIAQLEAKIV